MLYFNKIQSLKFMNSYMNLSCKSQQIKGWNEQQVRRREIHGWEVEQIERKPENFGSKALERLRR